jgi:hypothetical protein
MNKYLFLLFISYFPQFGKSQGFFFPDRKVYASAGREMKAQGIVPFWQRNKITFTLGEPFTIVQFIPAQNKRLNSGFIQPDGIYIAPGVSAIIEVTDPFIIAPNPVSDYAMIKAPSEWEGEVVVHLMDNSGKLIQTQRMKERTLSLDFQQGLTPGMYFLNLYNLDGTLLQQNKIIKTN